LQRVIAAAYDYKNPIPGMEPGLDATSFFEPPGCTFPFGTHIAVIEIDRETGTLKFLRYVAVDDCGRVISPMLAEGQVHGGIAQGIAQALYEQVVYDEGGQLRCSSCGSENPVSKKFCGDCGALLENRCPKCGVENPPSKRFCGDCGAMLTPPAAVRVAASARAALSAERRATASDRVVL
jgi:Molybdopterin-binding domain of aldehyde dehydrogenase/Double zinc ribbon